MLLVRFRLFTKLCPTGADLQTCDYPLLIAARPPVPGAKIKIVIICTFTINNCQNWDSKDEKINRMKKQI